MTDKDIIRAVAEKVMGFRLAWDVFPNSRIYGYPSPIRFDAYEDAMEFRRQHALDNKYKDYGRTYRGAIRQYIPCKVALVFPDRKGPRFNPLTSDSDACQVQDLLVSRGISMQFVPPDGIGEVRRRVVCLTALETVGVKTT